MGFFPFDPVQDTFESVPLRFRELDGKHVMLDGKMFARNDAGNTLRQFELVYNIRSVASKDRQRCMNVFLFMSSLASLTSRTSPKRQFALSELFTSA